MRDDKEAAHEKKRGEFSSALKPVDVERSFVELVLDSVHDFAPNSGVLLSSCDFLQMPSSKAYKFQTQSAHQLLVHRL